MSARITADERATAQRCVDCPSCGAKTGEPCHYIGPGGLAKLYKVPTHKRRVDKFYIDTYGPDSPAVKEMFGEGVAERTEP